MSFLNELDKTNNIFQISACPQHCVLCYNASDCYECTTGYYLDDGVCASKLEWNWWIHPLLNRVHAYQYF